MKPVSGNKAHADTCRGFLERGRQTTVEKSKTSVFRAKLHYTDTSYGCPCSGVWLPTEHRSRALDRSVSGAERAKKSDMSGAEQESAKNEWGAELEVAER